MSFGAPTIKIPGLTLCSPTDLFIAVMGVTGSGKSTFISKCANTKVEVGHGLQSRKGISTFLADLSADTCLDTQSIQIYPCTYGDSTVHLIDTPGFDDTYRRDIDVLKDVSFWLSRAYAQDIKLTGIIYLHRISDPRMGGVALKDLSMFKKLCGESSFASVALVTTFWEDVIPRVGESRETELRKTDEFYGTMLRQGSVMMRHENSENSARSIIAYLVGRGTTTVLHIQRELGDGKQLDETAAGAALEKDMIEQRALFNKRLEESAAMMQEALNANDQLRAAQLAEQQRSFQKKIDDAQKSRDELRVNMEKLFKEKEEQFTAIQEQLKQEQNERQMALKAQAKESRQWQQALKDAEMLFESRRKGQDEEMAKLRAQNDKVVESMALARQIEEKNSRMEENLQRAKIEDEQRRNELFETQKQLAELVAKQAQQPQNYTGQPPSYDDVLQAVQTQTQELQTSGKDDVSGEDIAAGAAAGAVIGMVAAAAPYAAIACSVM